MTQCWEEVSSVNGSGWSDLSIQLPPQMANVQAESWTSVSLSVERPPAEPSVWPQDMEGTENEFKVVLPLKPVRLLIVYFDIVRLIILNFFIIGSWTIVDGSHIPVSFSELTAGEYYL